MIDSMFQAGTDAALDDQVRRPRPNPLPDEPGFWTGLPSAVPRSLGGAAMSTGAFFTDLAGGFGDVFVSKSSSFLPQPEHMSEGEWKSFKDRSNKSAFGTPEGDFLRSKARDIMPSPDTTGTAGMLLGGFAGFAAKATGHLAAFGPVLGPIMLAGDVGTDESDRLKAAGVDLETRTKAGMASGAAAGAGVKLPMSASTWGRRFLLGAAGGEATMVGQSAAEKAILNASGYTQLAATFDPLDPWTLGMGLVPGMLGAAVVRPRAKPAPLNQRPLDALTGMELRALKFDDVRLDAYAVKAAEAAGVPPEVLLAVKNVGERSAPDATSPAGAQGLMQFMPKTWAAYGKGDPFDPRASLDAAANYLAALHKTYGDWEAAVAHYNGGGAAAAAVRTGAVTMPKETAAYLGRVRKYLGNSLDEKAAAAVKAEPALVDAARVSRVTAALDATRLTPDEDLAGREQHVQAVETAADQMGRGAPVSVADGLRLESRDLVRAWDQVHGEPFGAPDDPLVRLIPEDIGPVSVERGPVSLDRDGVTVKAGGYGLVKFIWKHGPESSKGPEGMITRDDLAALPQIMREYTPAIDADTGQVTWVTQRPDGRQVVYGTSRFAQDGESHLVTVHVDEKKSERPSAKRSMPPASSETGALQAAGPDTGGVTFLSSAPQDVRGQGVTVAPDAATGKAGAEAPARAAIDRAAAEVSALHPDMLVQLDGMDAPVRVAELLDKVKQESDFDLTEGKLLEAAVACALRNL